MKRIYPLLILLFGGIALLSNCVNEEKKDEADAIDSLELQTTVTDEQKKKQEEFKVPSPIELYLYLQNNKTIFNKDILNPVENLSKYQTSKSKAINFGIYASDLAYSTVFDEPQTTFYYYKAVKKLADELGLTDGFDEETTRRIKENINNTDSLYIITKNAYWNAYTMLESQGKSDILSYIIIGGWIESVHIAVNSIKKFKADNKIVIRISDQHLVLENIMEHLKTKHPNQENMKDIFNKLSDLQFSFDKILENSDKTITEEQYKEISKKITTIRNELTM